MSGMSSKQAPRELVLASAGTGKTFRVSSRILELLAAGSRPEAIFASSFTRKAAGEILDRVLARLAGAALDAEAARELANHAGTPDGSGVPTPDAWLALLQRVVAELHRLNVGTLDAFFVRAAGSFADEIGLPPSWSIADKPTGERVKADALNAVLEEADPGEVVELIRSLEAKDAARSVHDALLRRGDDLLAVHRALHAAATHAWDGFDRQVGPVPDDIDERGEKLAVAISEVQAPLTAGGTPNVKWTSALHSMVEQLSAADWDGLVGSTLFQAAIQEGGRYCGVEVPGDLHALARQAAELARPVLAQRISVQCRAMGRLAQHLATAVDAARKALAAYEFDDVTRRLGGEGALCERPDLFYRLDARVQHVLLDEFQDTSLAQWEALRPLLDRQDPGTGGDGAAVVVADPKQSIYGWRGGEPLLVRHVGERYALGEKQMSMSWRSSQVVLDLTNRVFERIEENHLFEKDDVARAVAADWRRDFTPHTAAKDLPGYVRVIAGPYDEGRGDDRPLLCRRAAELVAELRKEAPGRSIGVLTRRNQAVARIMLELRNLGIHASEEGGNPLTDSAAVAAVLSLLRLSDHPGDRAARYHVAATPLGCEVGLAEYDDDRAARHVAHRVRRQLVEDGYGSTLERLSERIAGSCEARDRRRLAQLAELGYRYDARATLRPTDFVRLVESERVEDPTAADVRVMTVHQSKGLEFDIVVLPELDLSMSGRAGRTLVYRPDPAGRTTRAFPYVGEAVRALFADVEELQLAAEQAAAARWRDALSGLYVALTRARHAVHVLVRPEKWDGNGKPTKSTSVSAARLVRQALGADGPAREGDTLFERGDPRWFESPGREAGPAPEVPGGDVRPSGPIVLAPPAGKPKALGQVTPSSLAGGERIDLGLRLILDRRAAEQGTLAHAWFEQIGWLEDGVPSDEELRAIAGRVAPTLAHESVEALRLRFRTWLATPEIRFVLMRTSYVLDASVEREVPFLHRLDGRLVEGIIDRLVLLREGVEVVGAEILDYKTDALQPGDLGAVASKVAHYQPQLAAYRAAVASWHGLPPEALKARLIFLDAGAVVEL